MTKNTKIIIIISIIMIILLVYFEKKRPSYTIEKLSTPKIVRAYRLTKKWITCIENSGNMCTPLASPKEQIFLPGNTKTFKIIGYITITNRFKQSRYFYVYQIGNIRVLEDKETAEFVIFLQSFYDKGKTPPRQILQKMLKILNENSLKYDKKTF